MEFSSHAEAQERFAAGAADLYPAEFNLNKRRHRREFEHIQRAFEHIQLGAKVLDLPCGTGRLTVMLTQRCAHITAADIAHSMVDRARAQIAMGKGQATVDFEVRDVVDTGYADKSFDAVVSYRLFHHFHEPELRQRALKELGRICKGPLIVSVFTSSALDYYVMRLKHLFRRNKPLHRSYIPLALFETDVAAAGFEVVQAMPRLRFMSPVWIYILRSKA